MLKRFFGVLLTIWWVFIFTLTHMPLAPQAAGIPYIDKVVHVVMYSVLAMLLMLWWHMNRRVTRHTLLTPLLILVAYIFIDEFLQAFVMRTPDIRDGLADLMGIASGVLLWVYYNKKHALY